MLSVVEPAIFYSYRWYDRGEFHELSGPISGKIFSELRNRRDQVEMLLCHGADYKEATADIFRDSLRAGMIPAINSLMGVGLVFLPGMMTGQILAGADPEEAVRYQIVVCYAGRINCSFFNYRFVVSPQTLFSSAMNLLTGGGAGA